MERRRNCMRVVKKKIEKKDSHKKLGGHGGKMRGDNSQKSKRLKHSQKSKITT